MTDQTDIVQLADEIRSVYVLDGNQVEQRIEQFLKERLKNLSDSESLTILDELISKFGSTPHTCAEDLIMGNGIMSQICSLLLGKDVSRINLSPTEFLKRLTEGLNTIFDSLDQLIKVINKTLFGDSLGKQGTRTIVGYNPESLEGHLGQINKAFSIAMRAFEKTVRIKVEQILQAIDPDQISAEKDGWLKIPPFQKAEYYEIFEEKHREIKKWFESDKFMEDFRREFEKNCQILSED
jgi:hypothetical protein